MCLIKRVTEAKKMRDTINDVCARHMVLKECPIIMHGALERTNCPICILGAPLGELDELIEEFNLIQ